jgi:hypothetical protein
MARLRRQHDPDRDPAKGERHPEDERINLIMDRRTGKHADERNDGQPVNGFHQNSPIGRLAIEAQGAHRVQPRKLPRRN